nr:hypothetical protein [Tanacetum cinerariifolium]
MKKKDQIEMDAEYHGFKKKPQSESKARKNMISYLKNTKGFKMEFFKGKTYDQILPIFQARFDANMKFLFKTREEMEKEDEEIIKSINETPAQKAAKRRKLNEEAQKADNLRGRLEIVQDEDDDTREEIEKEDKEIIKSINETPAQKAAKRRKLSEEAQKADNLRGRLEIVQDEDDDVFVEAIPLAQKVPIVDYQTMFGELDEQDAIWRNQKSVHGLALVKRWKLLTLCGIHVIILLTV